MAIEKTVELCRRNAHSDLVKSVLKATKLDSPKEVIAKVLTQADKAKQEHKVLALQRFQNANRNGRKGPPNNNRRGPNNGRGFQSNSGQNGQNRNSQNWQNSNNRNNQNNNGRNNNNFRYNYNRQNGNNGSNNNRNNQNVRAFNSSGNGETPPQTSMGAPPNRT